MVLKDSPTIKKYKDTMARCVGMYYTNLDRREVDKILDYSIAKRYKQTPASVTDSYKHTTKKYDHLLQVADYVMSREPIVTAFGTMFRKKGEVPNPLAEVVQSFMDNRSKHKKMMFKYPKGSEDFEKYNLLQALDKIDCNGIYGTLGMYTALIYNINVATSITSQGRALTSSMTMQWEMFLNNNVKFGSLNEVMEFIDHIVQERKERKYNDRQVLDKPVTVEDCFAKVVLTCGYRWIPNDKELDIIWTTLNNLEQEDINRIYYKNNLFEFVSNSKIMNIVKTILRKLKRPLFNSLEIPEEIEKEIKLFADLMMEYVYYRYMIIDRTDRCDNMIKSVTMVSDTDSTIISLDGWYRFIVEQMNGESLRIANYCRNPVMVFNKDEFGDWEDVSWRDCIEFEPKKFDYDFRTDEIVEREHTNDPITLTPNDNVRYSILNILAYVLDRVVNDYMEQFCLNNHSLVREPEDYIYKMNPWVADKIDFDYIWANIETQDLPWEITREHSFDHRCKILAKNEFTFLRLMMTQVKKNYASLIGVQEGNMVPEKKQLDIKGIECLTKSSKSEKTRKALQKILLEDILRAPAIDQLRFIKDIAVFEKQIIDSIRSGSKEYYKPVTIKSANTYSDPMRIQGIKASIVWNMIKSEELPGINLEERNAIDIAKVNINKKNVDIIAEKYPVIYQNMCEALNKTEFEGEIKAIAIPMDVPVPDWLKDFIDYTSFVTDNIAGFPYESLGVQRMDRSITRSNIVKL